MAPKRRLSSSPPADIAPAPKRRRTFHPHDRLSVLSDELLLRILGFLPLRALSRCRGVSKRVGRLASDGMVWKKLFVGRFGAVGVDSRSGSGLAGRGWRERYRLRDNWARGVCVVRGLEVGDDARGSEAEEDGGSRLDVDENGVVLVKLMRGWVVDVETGKLRSRALRGELGLGSSVLLGGKCMCLAVDEEEMLVALAFSDGGWGVWRLDDKGGLWCIYRGPPSTNGAIAQIAIGEDCVITMSEDMVLSVYTLSATSTDTDAEDSVEGETDDDEVHEKPIRPRLLTSLNSHTTWPPLTLSIRKSKSTIIASIAYSLPTYLSGWTIGIQELHLSPSSSQPITANRLATSIPHTFHPLLPSPTATSDGREITAVEMQPQALSYHHPYLLASYGDNTMTLYMVRSTEKGLWVGKGERLWGCTSGVRGVGLGGRGKAVSVCEGGEVRVWELERGLGRWGKGRGGEVDCVRVRTNGDVGDLDDTGGVGVASVGFDQEVVVVGGWEGVKVYDFA